MGEENLFDFNWQLDEAELAERGEIYDQGISGGLLRENRVALVVGTILRHTQQGQKSLLEIPLRCLVQSHPENRFDWFCLVVNFKANAQAAIQDLTPQEITGTEPTKHTVKYGGGLKFEVSSLKLEPSATYEVEDELLIYYPEITGVGIGTSVASWNFTALPGQDLLFDRPLRILLEVPADLGTLNARFTARGFVRSKSFLGRIPLLAQHEFTFMFTEETLI